jgi:hypothetical protein
MSDSNILDHKFNDISQEIDIIPLNLSIYV